MGLGGVLGSLVGAGSASSERSLLRASAATTTTPSSSSAHDAPSSCFSPTGRVSRQSWSRARAWGWMWSVRSRRKVGFCPPATAPAMRSASSSGAGEHSPCTRISSQAASARAAAASAVAISRPAQTPARRLLPHALCSRWFDAFAILASAIPLKRGKSDSSPSGPAVVIDEGSRRQARPDRSASCRSVNQHSALASMRACATARVNPLCHGCRRRRLRASKRTTLLSVLRVC
jgi:hypothetical protein